MSSCERRGVDLRPFPGDLDQRFGEIPVEAVLLLADASMALAQNAAKVIQRDQIAEAVIDAGATPLSTSAVTAAWI